MSAPVPARVQRPWRVIASEIVSEKTSSNILRLTEELNRALAQQLPPRRENTSAVGEQASNRGPERIAS